MKLSWIFDTFRMGVRRLASISTLRGTCGDRVSRTKALADGAHARFRIG
jgi:hypothetical protein